MRGAAAVSVPESSHQEAVSALANETRMKGGIRDNGEESQGREEEGRQETVSRPRPSIKGGVRRPLFNVRAPASLCAPTKEHKGAKGHKGLAPGPIATSP